MEWENYNWRHDDMTLAVFQECLIFLGITVFINLIVYGWEKLWKYVTKCKN